MSSAMRTTIRYLGSGSLFPGPDHDAPCCLVNDRVMVDTGYYCAHRLGRWGLHAGLVDHLLITHYHPDHMIGLPLFICYRRGLPFIGREVRRVSFIGPAGPVEDLMDATRRFLEIPEGEDLGDVVPLESGGAFESDAFRITAFRAAHPVPGLVYRLKDKRTSVEVGLAWDTSYDPAIAGFMEGVDFLVHDACHTKPREAALCAREAKAGHLGLIHGDRREEAVAQAKEVFAEVSWPGDGELIEIEGS
jgi:ribonuclease BN (tRNA processing enzyme)